MPIPARLRIGGWTLTYEEMQTSSNVTVDYGAKGIGRVSLGTCSSGEQWSRVSLA